MPEELDNIMAGIKQLQDLQKQQKQDPHKMINTVIAVFSVVCILFGAWMTINLTTQALQKDFTTIANKIDKMESLWLAVPVLEASHNSFKLKYEYEYKDICRQVAELQKKNAH